MVAIRTVSAPLAVVSRAAEDAGRVIHKGALFLSKKAREDSFFRGFLFRW